MEPTDMTETGDMNQADGMKETGDMKQAGGMERNP
jgi:hypothetical protein